MPIASSQHSTTPNESSGGRLVSLDGKTLPLKAAALTADAKAGIVRVTLSQTFENPHAEPLRVTYSLPLPADGAVSGFSFTIGDQRIIGEVDTRQKARARFEDAVLTGKTAAILEEERSSLFTQEVGNVPPRMQVRCEVTIDQKLSWLADGFWEWRFPTVVAPRYLGEAGRVADHARVTIDVADREVPVKLSLQLSVRDGLAQGARPESVSHALHTVRGLSATEVTFADEAGASLDRDVVVRWKAAAMKVGVELDVARPATGPSSEEAFGLLTLVPPAAEANMQALARDLIVLLDTSGSMSGQPLDQARRFTAALIDSLTDADTLELIEFSSSPRRWKAGAVAASAANRKDAQGWLSRLRASGGTEMASGIIEALSTVRAEAQRQVVLITDGLIGSEHEVLSAIGHRLPSGSRVHVVGVGSGVNRSLTQPAARAGRGVELVMGLGEDVEVSTRRLLARTCAPLITDVELSGDAVVMSAPQRLPDVYGQAPALLSMQLSPRGGTLTVRGRTAVGDFEETLVVPASEKGQGSRSVATLFARAMVDDLEQQRAIDPGSSVDAAVQTMGLMFQISTRLTSWVAISEQLTVDPRLPRRNVTQPQQLAYGLSAEGVGLRPVTAAPAGAAMNRASMTMAGAVMRSRSPVPLAASDKAASIGRRSLVTGGAPPSFDDEADGAPLEGIADSAGPQREESFEEEFEAQPAAPAPSAARPKGQSPSEVGLNRPAPRPAAEPEKKADAAKVEKEEAPKRRGLGLSGLVDRLVKAVTGATRRLAGRVLRQQGQRLDVELTLEQQLDWAPLEDALIELADGRMVKAKVNRSFTTPDGVYGHDLVLTLTLTFEGAVVDPARVTLTCGGDELVITLN